jgi:hypothetical protein
MDLKKKGDRLGNELYLDFMRLSAAFNVGHIYTFPPEEMLEEAIKNGDRFFPLFIKKNSEIAKFCKSIKLKMVLL